MAVYSSYWDPQQSKVRERMFWMRYSWSSLSGFRARFSCGLTFIPRQLIPLLILHRL